MGRRGWMVCFKPTKDAQLQVAIGTLTDVYDALNQWIGETPNYYSAIIYRPSGKLHRTYKEPDKR